MKNASKKAKATPPSSSSSSKKPSKPLILEPLSDSDNDSDEVDFDSLLNDDCDNDNDSEEEDGDDDNVKGDVDSDSDLETIAEAQTDDSDSSSSSSSSDEEEEEEEVRQKRTKKSSKTPPASSSSTPAPAPPKMIKSYLPLLITLPQTPTLLPPSKKDQTRKTYMYIKPHNTTTPSTSMDTNAKSTTTLFISNPPPAISIQTSKNEVTTIARETLLLYIFSSLLYKDEVVPSYVDLDVIESTSLLSGVEQCSGAVVNNILTNQFTSNCTLVSQILRSSESNGALLKSVRSEDNEMDDDDRKELKRNNEHTTNTLINKLFIRNNKNKDDKSKSGGGFARLNLHSNAVIKSIMNGKRFDCEEGLVIGVDDLRALIKLQELKNKNKNFDGDDSDDDFDANDENTSSSASQNILKTLLKLKVTSQLTPSTQSLKKSISQIMSSYDTLESSWLNRSDVVATSGGSSIDEDGWETVQYKTAKIGGNERDIEYMKSNNVAIVGGGGEGRGGRGKSVGRKRKRKGIRDGHDLSSSASSSTAASGTTGAENKQVLLNGAIPQTNFYRFQFKEQRKKEVEQLREQFIKDKDRVKNVKDNGGYKVF